MTNATHYIGIGAAYIAIVTTNMTNAARYISIALFQIADSVKNLLSQFDYLGESTRDAEMPGQATQEFPNVIQAIARE